MTYVLNCHKFVYDICSFTISALPGSFQSAIGGLIHDSGYMETVREVSDNGPVIPALSH